MASLQQTLAMMTASFALRKVVKLTKNAAGDFTRLVDSVDSLNKKLGVTGDKSDALSGSISEIMKLDKIKLGMGAADNYLRMQTRLKAANTELQTQADLQSKVFAAANRSRTSYSDMVNTFADLKTAAGNAFGSNSEALGFTELIHKSYKLGGSSSEEQSSGIGQVVNAMGSGKVDSSAFDNMAQGAPAMLKALETFTGKSRAELRSMASEGILTADTLKKALFAASKDINDNFVELPMTFADVWSRIKNAGIEAFGGVMDRIEELMKSNQFQAFLDGLVAGIYLIGDTANWLVDTIISNWDTISPILAILGGVVLTAITAKIWETVAALFAQAGALFLNYWPLMLIIGAIALAILIARQYGATWEDILGVIGGVIGTLVVILYDCFALIWNIVANVINFIGNAVGDAKNLIETLFFDLMVSVLGFIEAMAKGLEEFLNFIGIESDISVKITEKKNQYMDKAASAKEKAEWIEFVKQREMVDPQKGYDFGSAIGSNLPGAFNEKLKQMKDGMSADGFSLLGGNASNDLGTPSNPVSVQGTGSNGNLAVDMAEEDIQYLRDIAERDYINKFSTATVAPNIQVSFGDIHKEADADKVAGRIQRILREQIATAGEGVY
ncbi:MAG: phage tape measure protein [Bacillota bacterium]|jgi:tape measure domain-containing protein|nr:phage tape measure protein [Bacillota bacterium]